MLEFTLHLSPHFHLSPIPHVCPRVGREHIGNKVR
jgi:hypothetical protein